MAEFSPLHDDLTFLSPLSEERAEGLVRFIAAGHPDSVIDIGCGWGELLLRAIAAAPGSTGLGVDLDAAQIEEGRRRASERGLAERVSFETRDAQGITGQFDAAICIGASQAWAEQSTEPQPLSYGPALAALRSLLRPGGRLAYGEAIWSKNPTAAATAALGGRDDEHISLDDLVALATQHGFSVEHVDEASQQEWDDFESGFVEGYVRWLDTHPAGDSEAEDVREQLREQRELYANGYRGVLGMAYLTLIAR